MFDHLEKNYPSIQEHFKAITMFFISSFNTPCKNLPFFNSWKLHFDTIKYFKNLKNNFCPISMTKLDPPISELLKLKPVVKEHM